jgi:hypothetical protein
MVFLDSRERSPDGCDSLNSGNTTRSLRHIQQNLRIALFGTIVVSANLTSNLESLSVILPGKPYNAVSAVGAEYRELPSHQMKELSESANQTKEKD